MVNVFSQERDSIRLTGVFKERICSSSVTFNSFSSGFRPLKDAAIKENSFHLYLPETIAPGVYQVQYNTDCGKQSIDVIINGIDREISFVKNLNNEFPTFIGSEENSRWSIYKKQTKSQLSKLGILYNFLSYYPVAEDEIVLRVSKAVTQERKKYYDSFDKFVKSNKNTWVEKMVSNQPYYFSDPRKVPTKHDFIRRDYYWDDINTTDPLLMNSPLYGTLIDNYMDFQNISDYSLSDLEVHLKKRAAVVIQKFGDNAATKAFALSHLKERFIAKEQHSMATFMEFKYGLSVTKL